MNKTLFEKYISDKCSPSEIDDFFHQISKENSSINTIETFQKHWYNRSDEKELDTQTRKQQLDSIHHQINLKRKDTSLKSKRSIFISFLSKAAILILIPFLSIWVYTSYIQEDIDYIIPNKIVVNEIISPIGSRIKLDLSDGTKVWLNHGSKLIYPQQFSENKRSVKLIGDAYFDVFHNPEKPFIVETESLNVIALGTAFNVNAYSNNKVMETTLVSGKVVLKDNLNNSHELKPGQQILWNKKKSTASIKNIDTEKYISWKDGKMIFQDDSFQNIANRLERWYNVDIEIDDPKINELTFTATFIDEPLYQILEMLEIVSPIKFENLKRTKLKDGTYSKKKIKVSLIN